MSFLFSVSPDFTVKHLSGWYIFNTWLQRTLGQPGHLELFDDFEACRAAIRADRIDLIYANPYDAALLIREKGFLPLVHPRGRPDEALIATRADSALQRVEECRPGLRVSSASDPEVHAIGMIMLEAANVYTGDVVAMRHDNFLSVAKDLLNGSADIGFFLAETYQEFSASTHQRLRVLLQSRIDVIHHLMLISPRMADQAGVLLPALVGLADTPRGTALLADIGIAAWLPTDQEEAEFMVDLMDTLQ
jgi:phosphonate transport system substrate-binding protein